MHFDELRQQLHQLQAETMRVDCDNLFEAVFSNQELTKVTTRLEEFFGVPVWPSQNRLSMDMQAVVQKYGGVMAGQTLYFRAQGEVTLFAMLWPWSDGVRTTIKVVKQQG